MTGPVPPAVDAPEVPGVVFEGLGIGPHPGVLVLHGSGGPGGYERAYARLLAHHGYTVLCPSYFGAEGVPDALVEVPLELFERAADALRERSDGDRVGVVGFSRGGEAALLAGARLEGVGAVVAYGASGYAFQAPAWMDGVDRIASAWSHRSDPVPFVRVDDDADATDSFDDLPADERPCVRAVERTDPERLERARIAVEEIEGPVLLVSGGDDRVWDAAILADAAVERLDAADHSWHYRHLVYPDAGHAIRVPYDPEGEDAEAEHPLGGTVGANARAAADAWPAALEVLRRGLRD